MATMTYAFQIDWNNDGDFSDANEDISAYVIEAEWEIGCARAYDRAAAPGWLRLTVDNCDRRFSPEYAAGPLYGSLVPMRYVRVQTVYDGVTYTQFSGYLWRIEPEGGRRSAHRAVLYCVDAVALLEINPVEIALQTDKRSDEVIDAIIQAVAWPPVLVGYWVLGVSGNMELGETTRLNGKIIDDDYETGRETFAHAGDTWFPEQTAALEAVRETCASEYGRFYFTREGTARFLDRHWLQKEHAVAVTLDDSMAGLAYRRGMDALYNDVVVHMDPRVEGSPGSVLWQHEGRALRLPANSARAIRAPFVDDQGRRHGASAAITPVAATDFTANSESNGSGTDYTNDSRLSVGVEIKATGAEITLQWGQVGGSGSPATEPVYITSLRLRGTPLKAFDPEEIAASDQLSITKYQRRRLIADAPLLNDPATGYAMAQYLTMLYKDPAGAVAEVTLSGAAHPQHVAARALFDVVRLSETQTALSAEDYFIIAAHHRVENGGRAHTCAWRLEPAPPFRAWLLDTAGRAELGQSTWLGF